jgi:hypothetical protein
VFVKLSGGAEGWSRAEESLYDVACCCCCCTLHAAAAAAAAGSGHLTGARGLQFSQFVLVFASFIFSRLASTFELQTVYRT